MSAAAMRGTLFLILQIATWTVVGLILLPYASSLLSFMMEHIGFQSNSVAPSSFDYLSDYQRSSNILNSRREFGRNHMRWVLERQMTLVLSNSVWVGKGNRTRTRTLMRSELNSTNLEKLEQLENLITYSASYELKPDEEAVLYGEEPVAQDDPSTTFHGKTFIDVGVHHNECWEDVFKSEPMVNWTGLVIEMDPQQIDYTLLTRLMPFCASNSNISYIGITKDFIFEDNTTHQQNSNASELGHSSYTLFGELTLLPLHLLNDSLSEGMRRRNFTRVIFKPIPCFPLYSIMLAGEVTEPDYLAIGTGSYSGDIAESLPWSDTKLRPKVVRLADMGAENSTLHFLKGFGYELDEEISRFEPKDGVPRDFVFFHKG
ncbi:unnamed protein product [Notodromas monacha]|uniref:Uncharacterized protein n=1 Tax=Notodromas monacha TaxID=399045 RepID=A0A7R9BS14_9CRUS|nr:unnamed protein product [Notodromas monacha]CAG0919727.1 unnamed protein product [Notodromas monacha]